MKKLSIILICVLLLVPAVLLSVLATAGSAELTAGANGVQPGGTVEFTAYLEGFPEADSLAVTVTVPEGLTVQSGQWLLSDCFIQDYNATTCRGIWGSTSLVNLSEKTAVFKLVCTLDPDAAFSQVSEYAVAVNFIVKGSGEKKGEAAANATVDLVIPATELTLDKTTLALDLSATKTAQLTATYAPVNTTETLQWSSNNEAVATVTSDGAVTALAEGTATMTAKIGSLTKTCQVTVSCGHSTMDEHKANEPTCKETGNNLYYVCQTCGDVFKADKTTPTTVEAETLATVSHKGGTATCTAQALCDWCEQPYGNTLPHDFAEKIEDAAHFVAGSGADCQSVKKYYYDCTKCNTIGTTTFDGTTKGNHKMSTAWTTENGKHFHKCTVSGCTYTEDTATCSGGTATCVAKATCSVCTQPYGELVQCNYTAKNPDAKHLVSAASCTEQAVYKMSCPVCNKSGAETFTYGSLLPHDFKEKIEDAAHFVTGSGADCQSAKKYYCDCTKCNTIGTATFESTTKGNHEMSTAWTTENGKHFHKCTVNGCTHTEDTATCTGGTATCTAKAVCGTCGVEYGQKKEHTYSATWTSSGTANTDTHYQLCTSCQAAKDKEAAHSFVWDTDTPATEDTLGKKHEECTVCKTKRNEGTDIPKLPHVHEGITYHGAVPATCVATGNVEYWTCSSAKCAGKYYGDEKCATELAAIATAINPDNHTGTQVKDKKAANCYQDGYTGDTYCTAKDCGKKVASGKVIPATGNHSADSAWCSNSTKHWHSCTTVGCTAKVDERDHSYQWELDKAATEDETGLKHEECVCGVKRNEGTVIPKLDHVHTGITHHDAVKATCIKEGTVEYWTCSSSKCAGKYYADASCQLVLDTIKEPVNKDNHTGETLLKNAVEATCGADGYTGDTYCASCQALIKKGEVAVATGKHTPKKEYEKDDKQHWQLCDVCDALIDNRKEEHTFSWVVDKQPTESADGKKHRVCGVCGYICNEDTAIEKLPHKPERVDGKLPTCTQDGVAEHYLCENCGRYYASANGQVGEEVKKDSLKLPATGHSFGTEWKNNDSEHWNECACGEAGNKAAHTTELVNAKEATQTETGYTGDKVCSVCKYVVEQGKEIPVIAPEGPVDTKVEVVEGGIATVPDALQQAGLETPKEVQNAIVEALTKQNSEVSKDNIVHYDVVLKYTQDGGKTWINADETHFPENGKVKVVLPYPAGTDASYTFTVVHMFTSNAFGKTPGDVELPVVTNTPEGIAFEVTGLSPISVGWTAPQNDNPVTADVLPPVIIAILAVAVAAAIAGGVIVTRKKRAA